MDTLGGAWALEAREEAVGHRSVSFRPRGHPQSDPGPPGNEYGKFHFRLKNQVFHDFWGISLIWGRLPLGALPGYKFHLTALFLVFLHHPSMFSQEITS